MSNLTNNTDSVGTTTHQSTKITTFDFQQTNYTL
ncbi:hypothetical protein ABIB62_001903 [Mucilaginibacter sp. UYP25]